MKKTNDQVEQLNIALYLLKKRFHTPIDLVSYWAFSGPCIESHPVIEDYPNQNNK